MESKFKVGDRVRQIKDYMWRGIEGVYDGRSPDGSKINEGMQWDYFIPDAGSTYSNGDLCTFAGRPCGMAVGSFELIETPESKALSLLRKIVDHGGGYTKTYAEAKVILDELDPIDPDLIEARDCVAKVYEGAGRHDLAEATRNGKQDGRLRVQSALAAIKRGRELERGE